MRIEPIPTTEKKAGGFFTYCGSPGPPLLAPGQS